MKKYDFAKYLTEFISYYLPEVQNLSTNTISSYCDTYRLLLSYLRDVNSKQIEKLAITDISHSAVEGFLEWLESERGVSAATRNQRLAAICSFIRYIQTDFPERLLEFQRILDIPQKKKISRPVKYLSKDEVRLVLEQPDTSTKQGRRDATIISVLYDTGARVQELCDLTVRDVRFDGATPSVKILGKGRKIRLVPLLPDTVNLLKAYFAENRLNLPEKGDYPLFVNRFGNKFTRAGIKYILSKSAQGAIPSSPHIPKSLTPHILRHTKAMHTYEAGANIIYVRDILGHADIKTTSVYAKASLEMKRKAMEKVADSPTVTTPSWTENPDLIDWLKSYGRVST